MKNAWTILLPTNQINFDNISASASLTIVIILNVIWCFPFWFYNCCLIWLRTSEMWEGHKEYNYYNYQWWILTHYIQSYTNTPWVTMIESMTNIQNTEPTNKNIRIPTGHWQNFNHECFIQTLLSPFFYFLTLRTIIYWNTKFKIAFSSLVYLN